MTRAITKAERRLLIDMRHKGESWARCGEVLDRSASVLRSLACRLRDADKWRLPNGHAAKGAPRKGKQGRPRNTVPSVSVTLRFAPEIARTLRDVAEAAELRLGEVIAEAVRCVVAPDSVESPLLGLDPGEVETIKLVTGLRSEVVSVYLPRPLYDHALRHAWDYPLCTFAAAACRNMLQLLNYRFVTQGAQ